jgi:hypothetical protein
MLNNYVVDIEIKNNDRIKKKESDILGFGQIFGF